MKPLCLMSVLFLSFCSRDSDKHVTKGADGEYMFELNHDTYFKRTTKQSRDLPSPDACFLPKGSRIPVSVLNESIERHIYVRVLAEIGCGFEEGYFYASHVKQNPL
jgi:hypothetical protein